MLVKEMKWCVVDILERLSRRNRHHLFAFIDAQWYTKVATETKTKSRTMVP